MTRLISISIFLILALIAGLCYGADGAKYAPDANTLALWHLDEGDGDIVDASPNGFDGVVEGTNVWGNEGWIRAGSSGTSFAFDGATVINIGNIKELITLDAITVEAWIYADDLTGWRLICCNWGWQINSGAYHLACQDGVPKFHVTTSDGESSAESAETIDVEQWYHIAGTYDEGTGEIQLYIDAAVAASTAHSGELIDNDMDVVIGSKHSRQYNWIGQIDEVRISNVARTPDELNVNMEESSAVSAEDSLILTWGSIKNSL